MKTIKVRIAVAIDPGGQWCARGCSYTNEKNNMETVVRRVDVGEKIYWLEVELPVPDETIPVIQAQVSEGVSEV